MVFGKVGGGVGWASVYLVRLSREVWSSLVVFKLMLVYRVP